MPVSDELRCIHVHIPKTGGTSVERALGTFGPWQTENRETLFGLVQSDDLKGRSVSAFLQHFTAGEIRDLIPDRYGRYFSFAFVRNPWDRLYSAFSRKDVNLTEMAAAHGLDAWAMDFDAFVDLAGTLPHVHFRPQCDFVEDGDGRQIVDFVGRYERFAADFRTVCDRIGTDRELPHANRSEARTAYRAAYDERTRQAVAALYARDIELFDYEF